MAETRSKHRLSSKVMLVAVVLATLGLIGLCIYAEFDVSTQRRGSAGPLFESLPGKDPPPLIMRPRKKP